MRRDSMDTILFNLRSCDIREDWCDQIEREHNALLVIVHSPRIRRLLEEFDPEALKQCEEAAQV